MIISLWFGASSSGQPFSRLPRFPRYHIIMIEDGDLTLLDNYRPYLFSIALPFQLASNSCTFC